MFAIRLLPPDPDDTGGVPFGEIEIGEFRERFRCQVTDMSQDTVANWLTELSALVHGEPIATLRHDPRMAWIVYREGDDCYVQKRLSLDGTFGDLQPRKVLTEVKEMISTWTTSVTEIRQFLRTKPGVAQDTAR
jgi:hypothetical protein